MSINSPPFPCRKGGLGLSEKPNLIKGKDTLENGADAILRQKIAFRAGEGTLYAPYYCPYEAEPLSLQSDLLWVLFLFERV